MQGGESISKELRVPSLLNNNLQQIPQGMFIRFRLRPAIPIGLEVNKDPSCLVALVRDLLAGLFVMQLVGLDEFQEKTDEVAVLELGND